MGLCSFDLVIKYWLVTKPEEDKAISICFKDASLQVLTNTNPQWRHLQAPSLRCLQSQEKVPLFKSQIVLKLHGVLVRILNNSDAL